MLAIHHLAISLTLHQSQQAFSDVLPGSPYRSPPHQFRLPAFSPPLHLITSGAEQRSAPLARLPAAHEECDWCTASTRSEKSIRLYVATLARRLCQSVIDDARADFKSLDERAPGQHNEGLDRLNTPSSI
ncbi:hypothetical protein EYF80_006483 [Liparis tanakae]|uniref:Uncharacterized protein n=1 Tax=Liparis tanakae TaxID=230148 RepID=A0A4Z2J1Z7_9TELE|nr:hypothetical protein EYF80_006483 [Liparis tanakae]